MTFLVPSFLDGSFSFLQVTSITIKAWMSLNFSQFAALELLKNQCTLTPSCLIGSSSFLQVMRTTMKVWMSLNLKKNQPQTVS